MNINPVEFKCLIKPDKIDEQTDGGLWVPDQTRDRQQFQVDRGEVVAIGEGFFSELPGPVPKIGDKVMFNKYGGTLFDVWEDIVDEPTPHEKLTNMTKRKVPYRLLNDKDICAILEE